MHDYFNAIVLGIVEGLTEFLPVSSTGHMILVEPLLGVDQSVSPWKVLLWVSQLGAILAVVVLTWRSLWKKTFHPPSRDWRDHIVTKLLAAMIPTAIIALPLKDTAEKYLENPPMVAVGLIVGAIAMALIDRFCRRTGDMEIEQVSLKQAAIIGVLQCLSMWSGISRAGATIMGGMAIGLTPRVATEFSFYLAIPTMLGATLRTLVKYRAELTADVIGVTLVGTLTAFLVALLVVAGFLRFVRTQRFTVFVVYRVLLGAGVLTWWLASGG